MLCKVTHCTGRVSAKTRPLSTALGWLGSGECYLVYEYCAEIPCEMCPVHWTRCARNSRNSLKEADYMYIRIDVLQVTHCAEHVPAITRPHQMHLGGLGMGPQVEIQYLHCTVRYRVKYTGLYNNQ